MKIVVDSKPKLKILWEQVENLSMYQVDDIVPSVRSLMKFHGWV